MTPREKNRLYQREFRKRMTAEERKEHDRQRYLKNKVAYNRRSKDWAERNPHKSQASVHQNSIKTNYPEAWRGSDIVTKELADWLLENRGKECPYCSSPSYHIDHMHPLCRDGSHTWSNIELICKTCNFAKSSSNKEEFLQWIHALVKKFT